MSLPQQNCSVCDLPMELRGSREGVYWHCPVCKHKVPFEGEITYQLEVLGTFKASGTLQALELLELHFRWLRAQLLGGSMGAKLEFQGTFDMRPVASAESATTTQ